MARRFAEICRIIEDVLDVEPDRLDAALEDACGEDWELRRDVEELLHQRDALPSLLCTGGSSVLLERASDDGPSQVGPYRVVSPLGEGGMARVYLAEQAAPVNRRVALKLIKPGLDTRAVIARFEAERQTLAALEHPNIAKMFDAGATEDGHPYFAMEFVPGVPMTRFCDLERVDLRGRLGLFATVCSALHHAHERGVIHRDIKPSNVLVSILDGEPVPKVIDFGIAKAAGLGVADATMFTLPGQIIGTPEYMSPEQADPTATSVEATADVYSLGALLYELLSGAPPFDSSWLRSGGLDRVHQRIREEEPPRPSERVSTLNDERSAQHRRAPATAVLARQIHGDLDWITMRAMEKDPARRYPTAAALREDVQRFLQGKPVVAGPPSVTYRFGKLVRRHKAAFLGLAAVFVSLVAGLVVSLTMYVRAESAREEAELQARKAERVNEFLQSMLQSADPEIGDREVTVLEVLDATSERIDEDLADDPAVLGAAHASLGNTFDALGKFEAAERHLRASLDAFSKVLPPEHPDLGWVHNDIAIVLNHAGRYEEAETEYRDALQILSAHFGPRAPETAKARGNLAILLKNQGRYEEAEPLYREVLEISRMAHGDEATAVAVDLSNLAVLLRVKGETEEAIEHYREALAICRAQLGDDHASTTTIASNLAVALDAAGHYEEAEGLFREAVDRDRRLLGDDHPQVATDMANLSSVYSHQGKLDEATDIAKEALELRRRVLGDEHPDVAKSLMLVAIYHLKAGRGFEAESAYREALAIRRASLPDEHPDITWTQARLGNCLRQIGRRDDAESVLLAAWERANLPESELRESRRQRLRGWIATLYEEWKPEKAVAFRD